MAELKEFDPGNYGDRALSAYFRVFGSSSGQPSRPAGVVVDDRQYVVLFNVNGVLAVYRIRNDGALKRLRRYPKAIDEAYS